jgi:hypothetical protein
VKPYLHVVPIGSAYGALRVAGPRSKDRIASSSSTVTSP